jgi:hypothetical protein
MKFKKELLLSSLFIGIFFTLTPYSNADVQVCPAFTVCNNGEGTITIPSYSQGAGNAFPNGSIIKSNKSPKVYYIDEFQKRAIESPALFESRNFDWRALIIASQADVDFIPDGPVLTFRDGSLLSNRGGAYIISDGLRRPIVSPAAFLRLGFKWENVRPVSDAELNLHPLGEAVTTSSNYPDGVVIKTGSGKMYLVDDDKRRYVPSPLIFESQFKWNETVDLSLPVAPVYNPSEKGDVTIRDGVLISGEGTVWVTENNKKLPIYSPEIFESLGLSWGQVKAVTPTELASIPTENTGFNSMGKSIRFPTEGVLVKADNSPQIYGFSNRKLRPINGPAILFSYGYTFNEVITLPQRVIQQYPIGEAIPMRITP